MCLIITSGTRPSPLCDPTLSGTLLPQPTRYRFCLEGVVNSATMARDEVSRYMRLNPRRSFAFCCAALGAAVVSLLGATSASAELGRCQPWKDYRVVGQGAESVVLLQRTGLERVQVCHKPTGHRMYPDNDLGILSTDKVIGVQFVGPYVVYSWDTPVDDCGYSGLSLINAKARYEALLEIQECGESEDFDPVIVKRSGTVVWTYRKAIYACEAACRTSRRDPRTDPVPPRLIAKGQSLRPSTLRSTPRGIAWQQGGRVRHARIR
jgi:hypothetical protein